MSSKNYEESSFRPRFGSIACFHILEEVGWLGKSNHSKTHLAYCRGREGKGPPATTGQPQSSPTLSLTPDSRVASCGSSILLSILTYFLNILHLLLASRALSVPLSLALPLLTHSLTHHSPLITFLSLTPAPRTTGIELAGHADNVELLATARISSSARSAAFSLWPLLL
jgi:hypothetical protein